MSTPPTPVPGWPGAIGLNADWQNGLADAPRPLMQEQGAAGDDLLTQSGYGVVASRRAAVDADWVQIDWMRKYLAVTGEFPGNGNTTPGNNFFDMMNAMASFTRGARAIAQAGPWNALYAAKIADETPVWNTVCQWLMSAPVKTLGDAYNENDTHRYWLSASVLRNEAFLLRLLGGAGNIAQASLYDANALDYETQGLARQKGPGWMLALYPPFPDGRCRASILYNPTAGDAIPAYFDGTVSSRQLSGEGVRPEQGDNDNETWDAIYNVNGDKLAVFGIGCQPAGAHRDACLAAVDTNLLCCLQFLTNARDPQGNPILIDPDGSGRVGSLDIDGNPKKINPAAWRYILQVMAGLAPDNAIFGGSNNATLRLLWGAAFRWLDGGMRQPSAALPAPPKPADYGIVYPTPVVVAPSAPTGLVATAGDGKVALDWDDTPSATSYDLFRDGEFLQSGLTDSSATDLTAVNGTTYSYAVRAVNSAGAGPLCGAVSATPVAPTQGQTPTVPAAPAVKHIAIGVRRLTPQCYSEVDADTYNLDRTIGGVETRLRDDLLTPNYEDTLGGVADGTSVSYRYSGNNTVGEGPKSAYMTATALVPPPPVVVAGGKRLLIRKA